MTLLSFMVICSAFMCTALAIVLPFPVPRTIDEVAVELEETKPYQSVQSPAAPHCTLYTMEEGKRRARPGHSLQVRQIGYQRGIRFTKTKVLALINWVCLVMTIVSAFFLIYDVVAHGFLFRASLLPLALTIAFPILSSHAERSL
jgi:hypothetical protein